MSGGAYLDVHDRVADFADALRVGRDFRGDKARITRLRLALAAHLDEVIEAMREIDLYDSGDVGSRRRENAAIRKVIGGGK